VRRLAGALLAALVLPMAACGGGATLAAPETGSVAVSSQAALDLQRRAAGFYLRLANRRFNALETYHDFIMRGHFRTPELFLDYYADLAETLAGAHFERGSPVAVEALIGAPGRSSPCSTARRRRTRGRTTDVRPRE